MKKISLITTVLFFCCKVLFAASITEELSKLNDLYKSGALTEEEFSKAKSILLNESGEKIIIDAESIKALINESLSISLTLKPILPIVYDIG